MKLFLSILFTVLTTALVAQPSLVKQATINTTTNVIAPEEEDVQNLQNSQGQGPGGMNFRNMMDGETKFVTYLKNDLVKTQIKSEMGRSTIIRDNDKKLTTTIIEMMGNKMGFYITDAEQVEMQQKRDSMMRERRSKDTGAAKRPVQPANYEPEINISYTTEIKKIAGYPCTKAYVITTRFLGRKDTAVVWYTPAFKLQSISSTGGFSGLGMMGNMMGGALNGFDKIDGFVMRYEANMPRGRRMEVEVTKVDLTSNINDKEFDLPKDIEIKPMKEMQGMFGGGRGGMMRGMRD